MKLVIVGVDLLLVMRKFGEWFGVMVIGLVLDVWFYVWCLVLMVVLLVIVCGMQNKIFEVMVMGVFVVISMIVVGGVDVEVLVYFLVVDMLVEIVVVIFCIVELFVECECFVVVGCEWMLSYYVWLYLMKWLDVIIEWVVSFYGVGVVCV